MDTRNRSSNEEIPPNEVPSSAGDTKSSTSNDPDYKCDPCQKNIQ